MIDQDGEQAGIVSIQQALDMAEQAALDLVEISPNAEPPVCRIMNYGKFLYEKSKTAKEQKKKVEKEAIKNQFLEKTETKVKKAIKNLIYMTVDQEQYEVEVEVSE